MASYGTSDFKKGLKVQIENEPYLMVDLEFMKPGKGQAVYRVRLKSLTTGRVVDKNYRSGDSLEVADVEEKLTIGNDGSLRADIEEKLTTCSEGTRLAN